MFELFASTKSPDIFTLEGWGLVLFCLFVTVGQVRLGYTGNLVALQVKGTAFVRLHDLGSPHGIGIRKRN